jgi:hypothetical protein
MNTRPVLLLATLGLTATGAQAAPVLVTSAGQIYDQNFDTLTTATTSQTWTNDSTLSGWSLFTAGGSAISSYLGGTGSANTGSFYSFGATGNTERALGGAGSGAAYFGTPASGALAGYIVLAVKNSAGSALNGFSLAFDGEQWRDGGNTSAQTMVFEYGFGGTYAGVTGWAAPGGNFNWASTVNTSTAAAVNGNGAGREAGRGGNISVNWNQNDTLWLRWAERNDVGNDHGLAIDNLRFTAGSAPAPVPVPPALGLLALGAAALQRLGRRRTAA